MTLSKRHLPKKALQALKQGSSIRSSSSARPMLLEKQSKVTVVGGDQVTESLAAVMKKSLRRMGLLGRCDAKLQRQHVEGLAALWFSQHPGLDATLEAVRIHREAVQDTCPPAAMYTELKWLHWDQD